MPILLSREKSMHHNTKPSKKYTSPVVVDADNYPPNSRIFFTCCKYLTDEQLEDIFSQFGTIEYCRLLKDKITGNSKGSGFIKFQKTSSAAKAIEIMDNQVIGDHKIPLKIQIAYPKGAKNKKVYTDEPEDQPPRSRLFVVCPKEMKESTLHKRFQNMEGLEYTKVIADKETGESKGFAFIKFNSASSAALAMESITEDGEIDGVKVKVLIADPKMKSVPTEYQQSQPLPIHPVYGDMIGYPSNSFSDNQMYPMYHSPESMGYFAYSMMYPPEPYYPSYQQIRILISCENLTFEQLWDLFSDFYGFESCGFFSDMFSKPNAFALYNSVPAATAAVSNIHGKEFPPVTGKPIECSIDPYSMMVCFVFFHLYFCIFLTLI